MGRRWNNSGDCFERMNVEDNRPAGPERTTMAKKKAKPKRTTTNRKPRGGSGSSVGSADLSERMQQHEAQLRIALMTVTDEDRRLYLERLFIDDVGKMSKRKREKSLDAFLQFASIGFLADALFRTWANEPAKTTQRTS